MKLELSSFCRDHACPAREYLLYALVVGKVGKLTGGRESGDGRLGAGLGYQALMYCRHTQC